MIGGNICNYTMGSSTNCIGDFPARLNDCRVTLDSVLCNFFHDTDYIPRVLPLCMTSKDVYIDMYAYIYMYTCICVYM